MMIIRNDKKRTNADAVAGQLRDDCGGDLLSRRRDIVY